MTINRKIGIAVLCLLVLGLAVWFLLPEDAPQPETQLRVGAGDDVTGVLLREVQQQAEADGDGNALIGSYIFVDCCASAAQWAMQASEIDVGFFCSQAALAMVNNSEEFEIYAPIIMNGEVMAGVVPPEKMQKVGIPRKRTFLKEIVKNAHPGVTELSEVNRAYLLVSMNSGDIDSAVLDVYDASRATARVTFSPVSDTPYISYCLVVRRGMENDPAFQKFLSAYDKAIAELNTPEGLVAAMGMDEAFWRLCGTEFLPLS